MNNKPAHTSGFVLAADVSLVVVLFQQVEQVAVVELSGTVGLVPAGNLSNLNVT